MPAAKNIFIFGDSITYGEWDKAGGWANRVREYFDTPALPLPKDFVITYNLGIPSDTSTGVAQRLTQEVQARVSPNLEVNHLQIIIAIGTNDSRWHINEKAHGVDKQQFKKNLASITAQARTFTSDIVFVGLLPCVDHLIADTAKRFEWEVQYKNKYIQEYNKVLKDYCSSEKLSFIDLFERVSNKNIELLFDDGLHPNSQGHKLVFEEVINHLKNKTAKKIIGLLSPY